MASRTHDIPSRVSTPFKRASRVNVPGRGRFTSLMLALGAIGLILASGFLVILIYTQTTTKEAPAAEEATQGEMMRPMVDLAGE